MPDEFAAIRAGDEQAYEALFRREYEPLCALAHRYVHSAQDAEDIVQDIFAQVWCRRESLPPLAHSAHSYLYGAVRNLSVNVLAHRATALRLQPHVAWGPERAPAADRAVEVSEIGRAIDRAIQELFPSRQRVFRECVVGEREQAVVARELHVSRKAVEVNSRRARLDLRKLLAAHAP